MRHFRTLFDLSDQEFRDVLDLSHQLKRDWKVGVRPPLLSQRSVALLFEKPSLRTRLSFEAGMTQLGGSTIYLSQDVGWQTREATVDFVRVLAEYCDAIVCRTFSHSTVEELAAFNALPVINGLTDLSHPCQAMGDVLTMEELSGNLQKKQITFVGDANNVCRSLAAASVMAGMKFRLLGSPKYYFEEAWVTKVKKRIPDADIEQTSDPKVALKAADFVYTDVWTSMGQEAEAAERKRVFSPLQLNDSLMKIAPGDCKVLHCLPARRGEEITDEVIDSPNSAVIQQAGNRMHLQKGLLVWLVRENGWNV